MHHGGEECDPYNRPVAAPRRQRDREARGGAPDRRGLHRDRIFPSHRAWHLSGSDHDGAPAGDRLLRAARRREDEVQRPPAKISRGYNWVGDRSVAYSMGQAAPPDIQEAFAFGPESVADLASRVDAASAKMYAPNIWPDRPADFKKIMLSYYGAMSDLASDVLRAMATSLGVSEAYFTDKFDRQASVARVIRYSGGDPAAVAGTASRRHPHGLRNHDVRAR